MITEDVVTLAEFTDEPSALVEVGRQAGTHYAPAVAAALGRVAADAFAELAGADAWALAAACDPAPARYVAPDALTEVLLVVADFVDIKVPGLAGHSRGVAELAAGAATQLGLVATVVAELRHSALVHDLGRVTVSNAVWDKPGPLSSADSERVRLCPYHAERFCARSSWLGAAGRAGVAAPGTPRRLRLPPWPHRRHDQPTGEDPAGGRLLPGDDGGPGAPPDRAHRPAMAPAQAAAALRRCGRRPGPGAWTRRWWRRCAARTRAGLPPARSRCSPCSRRGCPTNGSPPYWWCPTAPSAATSPTLRQDRRRDPGRRHAVRATPRSRRNIGRTTHVRPVHRSYRCGVPITPPEKSSSCPP